MCNFRNFSKIISSLCFTALVCGCSVGNIHNTPSLANISSAEEARAEIKNGMTMDEVRAKWGDPELQQNVNDTIYWGYGHQTAVVTGMPWLNKVDRKNVNIVFRNGKVFEVSFEEIKN